MTEKLRQASVCPPTPWAARAGMSLPSPRQPLPLANRHSGQVGHCPRRDMGRWGVKKGPCEGKGRQQGGAQRLRPRGHSPDSVIVPQCLP